MNVYWKNAWKLFLALVTREVNISYLDYYYKNVIQKFLLM